MKQTVRIMATLVALFTVAAISMAQTVKVNWEFSDPTSPSANTISGSDEYTSLITSGYALGSVLQIGESALTKSGADTGYDAVNYNPYFTEVGPVDVKVTKVTTGHYIEFSVTPATGHTFKPTKISFDACKVGTDGGDLDVRVVTGSYTESNVASGNTGTDLGTASPLRNKIQEGNSTGYSSHEFYVSDINTSDKVTFLIYIYNVDGTNSKYMGFRNICIDGLVDTEDVSLSDLLSSLTFTGNVGGTESTIDITDLVKDLDSGDHVCCSTKLSAEPTNFVATFNEQYAEKYSANVTYANHLATVTISQGDVDVISFTIIFNVSTPITKGTPVALKRGTMAIHQSSGNLVSWRAFAADDRNLKFKLYRGSETEQTEEVNDGNTISGKTNYLDAEGTADNYYKLEVLDASGNVIETDVSGKTWDSQTLYIPLTAGAPTDPTSNGATYTPNDASYCDMDGDGEYEIILKWSPSNEKDASSSGATSDEFFDCYKLDGTQLWRIDLGPNFFASAHTTPFIAWDFDGDGFGEFMIKTGPGTIDGQGNYVIMEGDDPLADWKGSNGKQTEGPEYITVFDGTTGAELATMNYHTDYAAGASYWGDSNQNRSERYLAAIAWLDGEDANPSPIFARGYYAGAFVGAYDWDGTDLKLRWLSKNTTKGSGLYAEGAHWIAVGDCDGDGLQDIVYGSAVLKSDGSLLFRTGLGHGDALHLGDFDPDNDGLEIFMAHEESPYGVSLADAKTGTLLWHPTASSDTGRAIAGHFNPESEGSYFQYSEIASTLFDWNGDIITENATHGGGGSMNCRVFWDGLLSEDFYDKTVLEKYNPTTQSLDRIQVNGTNYTVGTLNNSTKYNPCVLGDLLGDWREEIVTWTQEDDGTYYLIVNATNYETDYTVPHLMDDANYRAQVINQNCCYNQPPHLSYDLRNSKKITRNCFEVELNDDSDASLGKYWDCFYTTYPVIIPEGITAWKVTDRAYENDVDTLKTEKLETGTILAPNTGIIYNSTTAQVTFVPTSYEGDALEGSKIYGGYCDTALGEHTTTEGYYKFTVDERGIGFYLADNETIEGNTGYAIFTGTDEYPLASSYVLDATLNNGTVTGISEFISNEQMEVSDKAIYNLQGMKLNSVPKKGIYIINGKKCVAK